jgi:hypothetical protein
MGQYFMTLQNQTPPDYSDGKQEALIGTVIRTELVGGTTVQEAYG